MAHSASELNYYGGPDEHVGKLIMSDIKQEPACSYGTMTIGGYSHNESSSSQQFTRVQNNYTVQQQQTNSTIAVIPHNSRHTTSAKNMHSHSGKIQKYIGSSSQLKSEHKSAHQSIQNSISRRRKPEKAGKGLRHFSMKVCEKVKEKGTTTYNEVADELVAEEVQNESYDSQNCDQKNIRRRVYDALNVLMAMNIISKDKKEIRWIGLPTNSVEQYTALEKENQERMERIETKNQELRELLFQLVSLNSLIERNKESERQGIIPAPNACVQLPFIIVNAPRATRINCSVTPDKSEYKFHFSDTFQIHDDVEVLKRMGFLFGLDKGECTYEDIERAKALVPKSFGKIIEAYGRGNHDDVDVEDWEMSSYMDMISELPALTKGMAHSSEEIELDEDDIISEASDID